MHFHRFDWDVTLIVPQTLWSTTYHWKNLNEDDQVFASVVLFIRISSLWSRRQYSRTGEQFDLDTTPRLWQEDQTCQWSGQSRQNTHQFLSFHCQRHRWGSREIRHHRMAFSILDRPELSVGLCGESWHILNSPEPGRTRQLKITEALQLVYIVKTER